MMCMYLFKKRKEGRKEGRKVGRKHRKLRSEYGLTEVQRGLEMELATAKGLSC